MKKTILLLGALTTMSACYYSPGMYPYGTTVAGAIDFGNDSGAYPMDNECDDPRFSGPGVWSGAGPEGIRRDATDCRNLYQIGAVYLR